MFVSLQRRDLTLEKLACLSHALRERRLDLKSFSIFFFDSYEAARYFRGEPVEGDRPRQWHKWAKQLHAIYSFDADKHEESLDISPMGFNTDPLLGTRIDLVPATTPHCRLEIQTRCVIAAMEKISYQPGAAKAKASGLVEVTGTVNEDGEVTGVHVADANVRPVDERGRLANAATQDLKTWHLNAAPHHDPIQIVYSFAVDPSLPRGAAPQVQWVPPNRVEVRTNPPD